MKLRVGDAVIVKRASGVVLQRCKISSVGIRQFGSGPDCAGDDEFRYQVRQKRSGDAWPIDVKVHLQDGDKIEKV